MLRKFNLAHQLQRGFKICVALAGKADNEIRGEGDVRPRFADARDQARDNRQP